MAEAWLLVGVGAALLLTGFAAALAFERWRFPDFLLLLAMGIVAGPGGLDLIGSQYGEAIHAIAPVFTAVAVSLLLFEGGIRLPIRGVGRSMLLSAGHATLAMALTLAVATFAAGVFLGLSIPAALLFAVATIGPSGSVVMAFAPRLKLDPRAESALVTEGVLANVAAALGVALIVQTSGAGAVSDASRVLVGVAFSALLAFGVGLVWLRLTRRFQERGLLYMATVGVLLALYAGATGLLGGSGAIAAFVFGFIMGNRDVFDPGARGHAASLARDASFARFHDEVTFLIRTFFFLYLGFLFTPTEIVRPLFFAAIVCAIYLASRVPMALAFARSWRLPTRDAAIVGATVSRGLTDAVLVLYGVEAGVVTVAEGEILTDAILLLVVVSALVTGALIWAIERKARGEARTVHVAEPPRL